jgi:hypothetical protein
MFKFLKQNKFQVVDGVQIPNHTELVEGFSRNQTTNGYYHYIINVSAERIPSVFARLSTEVSAPAFFLLEAGTHEDIEKELRKSSTDPFHKDVFYLDGITANQGVELFNKYENILVHDGMVNFGIGAHEGHDEVFVNAYKIFEIYADKPEKYDKALAELGFTKMENIKTGWDHFTQETPGSRSVVPDNGKTIWDMIEELKEQGLYFAERRDS